MKVLGFLTALIVAVSGQNVDAGPADLSFVVENLNIVDRVGDLSTDAKVEPLFQRVLRNKQFLRYQGDGGSTEFGLESGCDRLPNVFLRADSATAAPHPVSIQVEVEQVYYGTPRENMKGALLAVWAFGPLMAAWAAESSDVVTGYVQLRATLSSADYPDPVVIVGTGVMAGEIEGLSRIEAVDLALANAVWNTAFTMVDRINSTWNLGLKEDFVAARPEEYQRVYDAWLLAP